MSSSRHVMAILQFEEGPMVFIREQCVLPCVRAKSLQSVDSAIRWTSLPGSRVLSEW